MSSKGDKTHVSEKSSFHKSVDYQKAYEKWKAEVLEPSLEKIQRLKEFMTTSSQKVDRLYTPLDTAHIDFDRDISYPGEFPYTRGFIQRYAEAVYGQCACLQVLVLQRRLMHVLSIF